MQFSLFAFLLLGVCHAAMAEDVRIRQLGEDVFAAGGSAYVDREVQGDLIVAGGEVRIVAATAGDVLAAGGRLSFDGTAMRNARLAGGSVELGPRARIEGNASIAGGRVEVRGEIGGYLQAAGGRVLIDAPVRGDVEVAAGRLELGPRARIEGRLRYWGREALVQDPAATVARGIQQHRMPREARGERDDRDDWEKAGWAAFAVWTAGLMLLAAVLAAALPGFAARVGETVRRRPWWSLLAGFLALAALPVAIVLLMVTVVGIPLALLALFAYPALLLLGYVLAGVALGHALLGPARAAREGRTAWRLAAAALGVLAIAAVALVPWIGPLVSLVAMLAGMGAIVLGLFPAPATSGRAASP